MMDAFPQDLASGDVWLLSFYDTPDHKVIQGPDIY